jgi:hypothetical protein
MRVENVKHAKVEYNYHIINHIIAALGIHGQFVVIRVFKYIGRPIGLKI